MVGSLSSLLHLVSLFPCSGVGSSPWDWDPSEESGSRNLLVPLPVLPLRLTRPFLTLFASLLASVLMVTESADPCQDLGNSSWYDSPTGDPALQYLCMDTDFPVHLQEASFTLNIMGVHDLDKGSKL